MAGRPAPYSSCGGLVLGASFMPYDARRAVEAARAAEASGFACFGLPDSQVLWAGLYTTLASCAAATTTLRVGPHVTNVVTRHWTTTAAEFRTLDELSPGRVMLGLGTGDGAVFGIGRKPARAVTLKERIDDLRTQMPADIPVQIAAGGPRIAAVAGDTGSELIVGTGADRGAIDELREAAGESGRDEPWLLMIFHLAVSEGQVEAARREVRASVVAYARHALATRLDSARLPDEVREELRGVLSDYDFHAHARTGDSPNARLIAGLSPELIEYLERRFAVIGTPEQAADRLQQLAQETGIRRFWLACNVDDPAAVLRLGERMTARLQAEAQAA